MRKIKQAKISKRSLEERSNKGGGALSNIKPYYSLNKLKHCGTGAY